MINILPENEKKNIDREYQFRKIAVILFAVLGLIIIAIVALLPSYILAIYKSKTAMLPIGVQDAVEKQVQFKRQLDDAKVLIRVLKPETNSQVPSEVIQLLAKHKTESITINDISIEKKKGAELGVIVKGVAQTRDSLSRFTDALMKETTIAKVDVPVSNFAKDSNIAYSFTITTK
jgi:hypothetical protein